MDRREECNYKEKCYRKKIDHFQQFKHQHLEELLKKIGDHEIHVPFGYTPSVSFVTLKEQLRIEKKIQSESKTEEEPEIKKIKRNNSQRDSVNNLLEGDSEIFYDISSNNNSSMSESQNKRLSQKKEKLSQNLSHSQPMEPVPGTSSDVLNSSKSQSGNKTFEKQRVSSSRHSENMRQAEQFKQQVQSQMQMNIADKLKQASPYNILYTGLENISRSNTDRLSITFPELLDSPLGLLEDSLLINFMIQFGWVLACYFTMGHSNKPMTLLYGETDIDFGTMFNQFLKYAKVKPPSPFGSHHTKMMIFSYLDKSIRVVICTANLIESDWTNKTQGVWISDKCEEMFPDETGGDSRTNFKRDLLSYLEAYNLPILQPWIDKVKRADMSHINVFFIASVPGSHEVHLGQWGQARLRSVLKKNVPFIESNSYKVIAQISSIGSLGPKPDSWLMGDLLTTLSATKPSSGPLSQRPSLSVIYPTFVNVERSIDGLLGGGCLPYSSVTHRKQEWLSNYLNNWKSDNINRTQAVPHIKSYTRVSPDNSKISYFLLTSANLSKAAWGVLNKSGGINILSYEAGVLLLPEYLFGESDYFPLIEETHLPENERKPYFSLPYDLPLVPYSMTDIPWFIDNIPS